MIYNIFKSLTLAGFILSNCISFGLSAQNLGGTLSAPLSNVSFTYCNWNNQMATTELASAYSQVGALAYFYVTENTSINVVNGKCVNNLVANYIPLISYHDTKFDINNFGAVSNVRLINANPSVLSTTCNGDDTVVRFKDPNQDVLAYNSIVGNTDFNVSTAQESNNVLAITLSRRNYGINATNNITIYVDEKTPTNLNAGYKSASATNYNLVAVSMDKEPNTSKLTLNVNGICNSSTTTIASPQAAQTPTSGNVNNRRVGNLYWRNRDGNNILWQINNTNVFNSIGRDYVSADWDTVGINDVNKDGTEDILWRNRNTGQNILWMSSGDRYYSIAVDGADNSWSIVGFSDFNGDTNPDILWRNRNSGQNIVWFGNSNGNYSYSNSKWLQSVGTDWNIVGTSDFNNDGKADVLFRNVNSGQNIVWFTNSDGSINYNNSRWLPTINTEWNIAGSGDFNNDGKADIMFRQANSGQMSIWYMDNNGNYSVNNSSWFRAVSTDWSLEFRN